MHENAHTKGKEKEEKLKINGGHVGWENTSKHVQ